MRDGPLKPIHDALHELSKILKHWSDTFIKLAEELHTYDGSQTTLDGGTLKWQEYQEKR